MLDMGIVLVSIAGIAIESISNVEKFSINPTLIRFLRVLRIVRGDDIYFLLICPPFQNLSVILYRAYK